ncbi:YihY/virulence factor BrkB family protein [Natronomonas salina]|uniref:YihY/virulence factor BrkB family protein n=1 Tax=Natronomonas salina TaxID=1710540 RepID=UPI0015B3E92B|nr:YihY/virulence factor BrkB family protein [Natronomonas salina]QLD89009.1 YihY/virulence factor BrkB family protein [Natronomonas salina]
MFTVETAKEVVAVARRAQLSMLAAGLAYFAFTSLVPIVLLGAIVVASFGGAELLDRVVDVASSVFGDRAGSTLANAVFSSEVRTRSTVVALVVLGWSAIKMYVSSDRAFAAIYEERAGRSLATTVWNATLVFATNLVALALLGGIVLLFGELAGLLSVLAPLALLVTLVAVFVPMFYVFPRADVTVREVLPGAVLAAGTWTAASVLIGAYAAVSGSRLFGAASGLLLLFTWLYVGALAILLGATLNAVLGGRVDPDGEWVPTAYM